MLKLTESRSTTHISDINVVTTRSEHNEAVPVHTILVDHPLKHSWQMRVKPPSFFLILIIPVAKFEMAVFLPVKGRLPAKEFFGCDASTNLFWYVTIDPLEKSQFRAKAKRLTLLSTLFGSTEEFTVLWLHTYGHLRKRSMAADYFPISPCELYGLLQFDHPTSDIVV